MNICLFGSARDSVPEVYITETEALGRAMGRRGHALVFGGGAHGMMGAAARGIRETGGRLIGVAPDFFHKPGVLVEGCDELIITEDMPRRKGEMIARADGFVIAPGGVGTLDEFFEVVTLRSLGQMGKPIVLYNIAGFYDGLAAFLQKAERESFFADGVTDSFAVLSEPEEALDYLASNC